MTFSDAGFLGILRVNPQWLKLPMSRTNFHGPKDIRAIEVRLYLDSPPEQTAETYIKLLLKEKKTIL